MKILIEFVKKNFIIIITMAISILLGFLYIKYIPDMPVISDSMDYHMIAEKIIEKGTYITISNDSILYPPLYPIFISIIYKISSIGNFPFVYGVQSLIVGLISIVAFFLLKKFSTVTSKISYASIILILFWPYFILYSQLISSEILYSFLLILFIFLFLHINKDSSRIITIMAGLTIGLAILTRPVALLLLPWIIISLYIIQKLPKKFGEIYIPWKKYIFLFIIMILTVMPWQLFIKIKYDRVIPVASNLSFVFKKANKTFAYLPEKETTNNKTKMLIKAKIKNIYLFWNPGASGYHLDIMKEKYPTIKIATIMYKIIFFMLLFFSAIGIIFYRKNILVIVSTITILYFWALHTVLFPFPRYTLPIIPFVIILASFGVNHFLKIKK